MIRFFATAAILASIATPALANDAADQCRAYVAENGGDDAGCDCIGEQASADPAFADAIASIETPADLEAADDATKEKIAICYPEA